MTEPPERNNNHRSSPTPSSAAAFGQLTNGSTDGTAIWHVVKWSNGDWTTACTAITARPGLKVSNVMAKPGEPLCKLKRCERALAEWKGGDDRVRSLA